MARYDLTGIGINLREISDDTGVVRLKILGIILDGPAYLVGIRQVDIFKCFMFFIVVKLRVEV